MSQSLSLHGMSYVVGMRSDLILTFKTGPIHVISWHPKIPWTERMTWVAAYLHDGKAFFTGDSIVQQLWVPQRENITCLAKNAQFTEFEAVKLAAKELGFQVFQVFQEFQVFQVFQDTKMFRKQFILSVAFHCPSWHVDPISCRQSFRDRPSYSNKRFPLAVETSSSNPKSLVACERTEMVQIGKVAKEAMI